MRPTRVPQHRCTPAPACHPAAVPVIALVGPRRHVVAARGDGHRRLYRHEESPHPVGVLFVPAADRARPAHVRREMRHRRRLCQPGVDRLFRNSAEEQLRGAKPAGALSPLLRSPCWRSSPRQPLRSRPTSSGSRTITSRCRDWSLSLNGAEPPHEWSGVPKSHSGLFSRPASCGPPPASRRGRRGSR